MGAKLKFTVFMIFTSLLTINSERIVPFPDLMKPGSLLVKKNNIYVAEKGVIRIFDIRSGKLTGSFGKRGEGPGEFLGVLKFYHIDNKIIVSSTGKISIFTLNGMLISEKTVHTNIGAAGNFQPFGPGFVGMGTVIDKRTGYRTINIYDKNLIKIREIYRTDIGSRFDSTVGKKNFFKRSFSFRTIGSNIYVSGDEGFKIDVFNRSGNALFSIERNYKKIPFTSEDKKNFLDYLKSNSPGYMYENMSKRLVFPEYFPSVFFLYSDGQTLYAFTWGKSRDGLEAFLYDPDGKFVSRKEIPIKFENPVLFFPFTIKDNKVYQLVENEVEELWELHITEF